MSAESTYPAAVSKCWKIWHNSLYFVGGTTFLLGSMCYLPKISAYLTGGWLFTIGSAAFTFTDIFEWLKNNHVGCAFDARYSQSYQDHCEKLGFPAKASVEYGSWYWAWTRAAPGINFFVSVIGSTLYLIGSVLFIPPSTIVTGTWVFIYGSAFIYCSQGWKLYRSGCAVHDGSPSLPPRTQDSQSASSYGGMATAVGNNTPSTAVVYNPTFSLATMFQDGPVFGIDFGAGIGGLFYFFGSIFFLPAYADVENMPFWAAVLFICGGASFFASGLCMFYKYFIAKDATESLLASGNVV